MQARAEKAGVHRMGEVHRGKPKPLRPLKVVITNYPDVCKSWLKAKKAKG